MRGNKQVPFQSGRSLLCRPGGYDWQDRVQMTAVHSRRISDSETHVGAIKTCPTVSLAELIASHCCPLLNLQRRNLLFDRYGVRRSKSKRSTLSMSTFGSLHM